VAAPIARDILLRAQVGDTPPPELYPVSQRREIEEMHQRLPILPEPPRPTGREAARPDPDGRDRA
jgi:penicillin-binding protein 2